MTATLWDVLKLGTLFFFRVAFAILGPLYFHVNFKISLSISTKKISWDFDRNCVESIDSFGEYCHF